MSRETQEFASAQAENLPFKTRQISDEKTAYIFDGVTVGIDSSGKNYPGIPEIVFGQFDNETGTGSFDKADAGKTFMGMDHVAQCIKEVASATGVHTFWFYPYGDDTATGKNERRERARMKLFGQLTDNITPAPNGHGYILTI